jgi:protein TonB
MALMNVPSTVVLARTGHPPTRRILIVTVAVLLIHAALLFIVLTIRDEPEERPLESHTITAELISAAPTPVTTPVALQSSAPPTPVPPTPRPKPHPVVHHTPAPKPVPAPMKVSEAPSQFAPPAPAEPTLPTPPAPPAVAAAPAARAIGRETLAISAPKDVSHLDCNIAKPDYPYLSRRRGDSGTVVVHFVVGLTGRIEDIRLQKTSGYAALDDAALDAMHASACRPYLEDGKPVRAAYAQPFAFALTN